MHSQHFQQNTIQRVIHKYRYAIQKHCHLLWAKVHLKWRQKKNCSLVWWIEIWNFFWKTWRGRVNLLRVLSARACISDGIGVHLCLWNERHHQCLKVYTALRETYDRIQMMSFRPWIFQQANTKLHTASITTAWICSGLAWRWFRPLTNEHVEHHETKK